MTITIDSLERADALSRALGAPYTILGIALPNELFILRPELGAEFIVRFEKK